MNGIDAAFPAGDVPPIEVFEVGGAYFVSDGHHRVALARQHAATYIDADVTRRTRREFLAEKSHPLRAGQR